MNAEAEPPFPPQPPRGYNPGMREPETPQPPNRDLRAITAAIVALCGAVLIAGHAEVFGFPLLIVGLLACIWQVRLRGPKP